MRMTSTDSNTIPDDVRRALGIDRDSELEWEVVGDQAVLRVRSHKGRSPEELVARMVGRGRYPGTTDELLTITRGEEWNRPSPS